MPRPGFQWNPYGVSTPEPPLFTDTSGGWIFTTHFWKERWEGYRFRYLESAKAHRDEAICRRVACAIEDRKKEAAHWLQCQRFLENLYKMEASPDGPS